MSTSVRGSARRFPITLPRAVVSMSLLMLAIAACGGGTANVKAASSPSPVANVRPASPSAQPSLSTAPSGSSLPDCPSGTMTVDAQPSPATVTALGGARSYVSYVPWLSVGPGWSLADWASSGASNSRGTIYLISPDGSRYSLGNAPANATLEDWSGNGADAVFVATKVNSSAGQIIVVDLQTGMATSFTVPDPGNVLFSRADGREVLVTGPSVAGTSIALRRYSMTGAPEQCYGGARAFGDLAESPDGQEMVLDQTLGLEVISDTGRHIRLLPPPMGQTTCLLSGWWSAQSVLAACNTDLWVFPLSGAAPVQLTRDTGGVPVGAWALPSGIYVEEAACGSTWLAKLKADGSTTNLTIPGAGDAQRVQPLGTNGDRLLLMLSGGCHALPGGKAYSALDWYNPATNVATTVLGGRVDGGYVKSAVLFPVNRP
jgi:hypothetical protein